MPLHGPGPETVRTRASLVQGLQTGDEGRWQQFYDIYGPVIRAFAMKAGLNETQAGEVLQETAVAIARHVEGFRYDPKVCRFKTWLLNQTAWRVKDHLKASRRREAVIAHGGESGTTRSSNAPASTDAVEAGAAAVAPELEALWDSEWRARVLEQGLARIKEKLGERQYQIFHLNVVKEWPVRDVAESLGVSAAAVYLAKHRVSSALRKEITRLEAEMEQPPA